MGKFSFAVENVSPYEKTVPEKKKKFAFDVENVSSQKKNSGSTMGYLAGSLGVGIAQPFEGIADLFTSLGATITGDKAYAQYVYQHNVTGDWQKSLDASYNPGKGMQFASNVAQGVGQSLSYAGMALAMAPIAGAAGAAGGTAGKIASFAAKNVPMFLSSTGSYTADAVNTTGELSGKEYLYGVLGGLMETGLENALGAGMNLANRITGGQATNVIDKMSRKIVKNSIARGLLSDAGGEFFEEFTAEYGGTFLKRMTGVDPEARTTFRDAFMAGMVGAMSGAVLGGSSAIVQTATEARAGQKIAEKGMAEQTVKTAEYLVGAIKSETYENVSQDIRDLRSAVEAYQKHGTNAALGRVAAQIYKVEINSAVGVEKMRLLSSLAADEKTALAQVNALIAKPNGQWTKQDILNDEGGIATLYSIATLANRINESNESLMRGDSETQTATENIVRNETATGMSDTQSLVNEITNTDGEVVRRGQNGRKIIIRKDGDGYIVKVGKKTSRYASAEEAAQAVSAMSRQQAQETTGQADAKTTDSGNAEATAQSTENSPADAKPKETKKSGAKKKKQAEKSSSKATEAKGEQSKAKKAESEEKTADKKTSEASNAESAEAAKRKKDATKEQKELELSLLQDRIRKYVRDFDLLYPSLQEQLTVVQRFSEASGVSEQQAKEALSFTLDTGTAVVYTSAIKSDGLKASTENGYIILANPKTERPVNTVLHEVTHLMEDMPAYEQFVTYVKSVTGEKEFARIKEEYRKSYDAWRDDLKKQGMERPALSDADLEKEAVADACAIYLRKVPYLEQKASNSFVRKAYLGAAGLVKALKNKEMGYYKAAKRIQRAYARMLSAVTVQNLDARVEKQFSPSRGNGYDGYSMSNDAINTEDIQALRKIGRKSINEFTSDEIKSTEKWSRKFWGELKEKSPFFRAWFGDWRQYETSDHVNILDMNRREGKNPRGQYRNKDTGWVINSSSVGYDETVSHSGKDKKSIIAMQNIDKIIENSILLNTESSEYGRGKKSIYTAFIHKFYAPISIDGNLYLAKMSVDESYSPGSDSTNKKFYHIRAIEIETAPSVGIGKSHTPIIEDTVSVISISDLFDLVKKYDKEFSPKSANPLLLNDDGKPRVFYHGTRAENGDFTVFDETKAVKKGGLGMRAIGKGNYFTSKKLDGSEKYGSRVIPVYLSLENPLLLKGTGYQKAVESTLGIDMSEHTSDEIQLMLRNKGYDGVIDANGSDTIVAVFDSNQIKSASENIGTFDRGNPDIRYSPSYTSPTYDRYHVATKKSTWEKVKDYFKNFKGNMSEEYTNFKIAFVNQQAGIENFLTKKGASKDEAAAIVQAVRNSVSFGYGAVSHAQYDIHGKRVGDSLHEILKPLFNEKGDFIEDKKAAFGDYLSHLHNIDRMSFEQRSKQEQAERINRLKTLKKELSDLKKKKASVSAQERLIKKINRLKEQIDAFVPDANKPIFGVEKEDGTIEYTTSEQSRKICDEYEKANPKFKEMAEKLSVFNRNLNQYRVDTGLISQETADRLAKMYPHYIPTYRNLGDAQSGKSTSGQTLGRYQAEVKQTIKTANGSIEELADNINNYVFQVVKTYRAGRLNELIKQLRDHADGKDVIVSKQREAYDEEQVVTGDGDKDVSTYMKVSEKSGDGSGKLIYYENGKRTEITVNKQIFEGFEGFGNADIGITSSLPSRVMKAVNNNFKRLVTSWNPAFGIRNPIKDVQDALFYSKFGAAKFLAQYHKAIAEIRENGELWQLYIAMGGLDSSIFDYEVGISGNLTERGMKDGGLFKKISNMNMYIEQVPRFAEFMLAMQSGADINTALYYAADVTVNFSRSGRIIRPLNNTIMPFVNAAIQGMDKAARMVVDKKGVKAIVNLIIKCVILGIAPAVIQNLIYEDDDEYNDLRDTVKENNYLIKVGDTFVKLPRGRLQSVLAGAYNRSYRAARGESVDVKDYAKNIVSQMTPWDNVSRTLFSPFIDVKTNTTWYGGQIENQGDENKRPSMRYDEYTSEISKTIGKVFNYSPKKIEYLIQQYTGVIGSTLLPATTKGRGLFYTFTNQFTVNTAKNSRMSSDFYTEYEKYTWDKNEGDEDAWYVVKFMNEAKNTANGLWDESSNVAMDKSLSSKEIQKQQKVLRALINNTYKHTLNDIDGFKEALSAAKGAANSYSVEKITQRNYQKLGYEKNSIGKYAVLFEGQRIRNVRAYDSEEGAATYVADKTRSVVYAEAIRLLYGADRALEAYNKAAYSKAAAMDKLGIDLETYYNAYFATQAMSKEEAWRYITSSLGIRDAQANVLMYALGYTSYRKAADAYVKDEDTRTALNLSGKEV